MDLRDVREAQQTPQRGKRKESERGVFLEGGPCKKRYSFILENIKYLNVYTQCRVLGKGKAGDLINLIIHQVEWERCCEGLTIKLLIHTKVH